MIFSFFLSRNILSEWNESDEILRLRQASLKKEEMDLQIEYEKLERERNLHIRELKRIYNEDHSRCTKHFQLTALIKFFEFLDFKIILYLMNVIYY